MSGRASLPISFESGLLRGAKALCVPTGFCSTLRLDRLSLPQLKMSNWIIFRSTRLLPATLLRAAAQLADPQVVARKVRPVLEQLLEPNWPLRPSDVPDWMRLSLLPRVHCFGHSAWSLG